MDIEITNNIGEGYEYEELKLEIEKAITKCDELIEPQRNISKTILKALQFTVKNYELNSTIENVKERMNIPYVQKLSNLVNVDEDKLEQIINFKKDDFKVMTTIDGEKAIEKQFKATLIILTIYYIVYEKEEISSRELVEHLRWLGTGAYGHLTENLRKEEYKKFIDITGDGNNLIYKINVNGIQKGKEIIKNLFLAENNADQDF